MLWMTSHVLPRLLSAFSDGYRGRTRYAGNSNAVQASFGFSLPTMAVAGRTSSRQVKGPLVESALLVNRSSNRKRLAALLCLSARLLGCWGFHPQRTGKVPSRRLSDPASKNTRHVKRIHFVRILSHSTAKPDQSFDKTSEDLDSKNHEIVFELRGSISNITSDEWDSCLTENSSPFLRHSWIRCLEESGCASTFTGWTPQHVSVKIAGKVEGFVPLYIKSDSMGEFIFDQQFAEAAARNKINYYPKLLVGIPFTPATGQRILWKNYVYRCFSREQRANLNASVAEFLKQLAHDYGLSSVHCNFMTDDEATDIAGPIPKWKNEKDSKSLGFKDNVKNIMGRFQVFDSYLRRTSIQYHWKNSNPNSDNKPFQSFDEYLNCFKSKRRINIRRERRSVLDNENIRVDAVVGRDILKYDGLVQKMFEIYLSTIDKMIWGRQYLNLDFFEMIAQSDFVDRLVFMCARDRATGEKLKAKDVFAGTFNIVGEKVFYGRYWGQLRDYDIKYLHFETCYWSAIEFCIAHGIDRMEPGAGGADYKWARGFNPVLIHSIHYFRHPGLRRAIGEYITHETENNLQLIRYLKGKREMTPKKAFIAGTS